MPLTSVHDLDHNGLRKLDREHCLELLRSTSIGRIALTDSALPVVLPVSYALLDDNVVFSTSTGARLRAATNKAVVAFEADQVDEPNGTGWSVCITGVATEVTDHRSLERIEETGFRSIIPTLGHRYVRLCSQMMSGRLLTS